MSLLEDVFLQDEADEAQDLERVIEGDEYEEIRRQASDDDDDDGGVGRDDEAEEDKRRVDPNSTNTKKVVRNPRFVLNPARLTGPRGIHVIPEHFKDFKFKGKGHEKEDMDLVLKKLEHWAYRLYPKFKFADCLKKIETLGKKRPVMVNLHKIRSDQFVTDEEAIIQKDSSDDEQETPVVPEEDEFDKLLQQQIELTRNTPGRATPARPQLGPKNDISTPFLMPKATSSPSISDEQKQRMIENRMKAEQRRLARLQQISENDENVRPTDKLEGKATTVVVVKDSFDKDMDSVDKNVANVNEKNTEIEDLSEIGSAKTANRSKVLNYSDEDMNTEEIDLPGRKNEKRNITIQDRSNEEIDLTEKNGSITQKGAKKSEEIDLTDIRNVSKVLDSSDEEVDATGLNGQRNRLSAEIEEVDLTEGATFRRTNQSKILESSDDEMDNTEKNTPRNSEEVADIDLTQVNKLDDSNAEIDLTEKYDKSTNNKDNEISNKEQETVDSDSSEDECNVTVENVSITVDVHKANTAEIENKDNFHNSMEQVTKSKDIEDFDAISCEEEIVDKVSNDTKRHVTSTKIDEKTNELDNINEEVMDVDFSEEF